MKKAMLTLPAILLLCLLAGAQPEIFPQFQWLEQSDTVIYNSAVRLYEGGEFRQSAKTLKQLPKPVYAQAAVLRLAGLCAFQQEDFSGAVDAFSSALSSAPEAVGLHYHRAFAFMYQESYQAAASDFEIFASHFPSSAEVTENLAWCLYQDGQLDKAIERLEHFQDKDTTLSNDLGWYYIERQDYAKAIFLLEPLIQDFPAYPDAYETISVAFSEIGYTDEALQAIDVLISMAPGYGRAYYLKGAYQEEAGLEDEAEQNFRRAKRLGYEW